MKFDLFKRVICIPTETEVRKILANSLYEEVSSSLSGYKGVGIMPL